MSDNIPVINAFCSMTEIDQLRVYGRYSVNHGSLLFDWTNSGFAFNFDGSGFCIKFGEYKGVEPSYLKISVDGKSRKFAVSTGKEVLMVDGLIDGRHRVSIIKITEGIEPVEFATIALLGKSATFKNLPSDTPRKIEFLGDSITCGYGILGAATDPCFYAYQQDGTYTYAYKTAEALSADARYICASGKGVVCNCNGDREDVTMLQMFNSLTRKGGDIDDNWQAGVVVINAGTNDCGGPASQEEFSQKAQELIDAIRSRYNDAYIIWMYGMLNDYYLESIRNVVKRNNELDKKIQMLYVPSINTQVNELGANGHPNVRANIRAFNALCKKIRSITGWKGTVNLNEE